MKSWISLVAVLCFSGCGESGLPKSWKLDRLRVLALVANTPEVNPGATVTITPWVSDVQGVGRSLTYTAESCIDPGVSFGAEPTCQGNPSRVEIVKDAPITTLTAPSYTGAADTFSVVVPLSPIIFAGRNEVDQWNGVPYLVLYSLRTAEGVVIRSFRRILVSTPTKPTKNQNPQIQNQTTNDVVLTAGALVPGQATSLRVTLGAVGAETFVARRTDGSSVQSVEDLTVAWYSPEGSLKRTNVAQADPVEYTPTTLPELSYTLIVSVLRDGRGGSAVVVTQF
jgi:hypothetical protein